VAVLNIILKGKKTLITTESEIVATLSDEVEWNGVG
jgi:hypothetical protein